MIGYLDYLNNVLRPLWGNLIEEGGVTPSDYLRFTGQLDGYMHEAWATGYIGSDSSAERWEENLSMAETTLGQGKGLMATAQGEKYDYARQRFALASYLLVSNGSKAHFRYANWRDTYRKWYQYNNYNVKLGAPKGKRYRSGSSWRRDFACGYVIVNPGTRSGTIHTNRLFHRRNHADSPAAAYQFAGNDRYDSGAHPGRGLYIRWAEQRILRYDIGQ